MFQRFFQKGQSSVKAVYEEDILAYLDSLGVLNKIKEGKAKCMHCGEIITLENLEVIVPKKGEVRFVCWSQSCKEREI